MQIQIALPDDVAHSLKAKWGSLERKLLEMLAIAAYQEGTISAGKVRELLGMSTRLEVDAFLKDRGVYLHYDEADLEADRQTYERLRQTGKLNITGISALEAAGDLVGCVEGSENLSTNPEYM